MVMEIIIIPINKGSGFLHIAVNPRLLLHRSKSRGIYNKITVCREQILRIPFFSTHRTCYETQLPVIIDSM